MVLRDGGMSLSPLPSNNDHLSEPTKSQRQRKFQRREATKKRGTSLGAAPSLGSEFRVFGIAVNSYATSRIGRLSNHNIEQLKTCILYIICID